MQKIQRVASLRDALLTARKSEKTIALVATMGALHHGHADCIRMARERSDVTIVSIFVNPTQFSPGEDLAGYPRTLSEDLTMCQELGCDVVFVPGGTSHEIETVSDEPSLRLTITAPDIVHHYMDDPDAPTPPNG